MVGISVERRGVGSLRIEKREDERRSEDLDSFLESSGLVKSLVRWGYEPHHITGFSHPSTRVEPTERTYMAT